MQKPSTTDPTAATVFFVIIPLRPDFSPAAKGRAAAGLATIPLVLAEFCELPTITAKYCCDHHGFISCN